MNELPIVARAMAHGSSIAWRTADGESTYVDLIERSRQIARRLLNGKVDLGETRVAMLIPPGAEYASVMWGIWRAGGVALPLCLSATAAEWEYALTDSETSIVITTASRIAVIGGLCERCKVRLVAIEEEWLETETKLPEVRPERKAMILFTSGTTSKPKGVVSTHGNIQAQIESLVEAWEWQASDRIPLFLPLHHIHGIINIMSCALWSGAAIEPYERFDANRLLERVRAEAYTVFMAVPTIYVKLIEWLQGKLPAEREAYLSGFRKMRLMVSGSAALPASLHQQWFELTGQKLLERYGMTEIGMALSNPYRGDRLPGFVGQPLPHVEIRLKSESGNIVSGDGQPGEIQVRGPGVFPEYWKRPEITAESFDDGWFRTGDVAMIENGSYRILGRSSVDIIKSGGYKLSALEIESTLLEHPSIRECAVVGTPDDTWGEAVSVAVVLCPDASLDIESLRVWCRDRLSVYKIPKNLLVVDGLPRNAMGKVTKPAVGQLFAGR